MFGDVARAPAAGVPQATGRAEQAMADRSAAIWPRQRVADLFFPGCGSFALRLAARAEVHAWKATRPPLPR